MKDRDRQEELDRDIWSRTPEVTSGSQDLTLPHHQTFAPSIYHLSTLPVPTLDPYSANHSSVAARGLDVSGSKAHHSHRNIA